MPESYLKDGNGYNHGDDKEQKYFTTESFDQYVSD